MTHVKNDDIRLPIFFKHDILSTDEVSPKSASLIELGFDLIFYR